MTKSAVKIRGDILNGSGINPSFMLDSFRKLYTEFVLDFCKFRQEIIEKIYKVKETNNSVIIIIFILCIYIVYLKKYTRRFYKNDY